MKLMTLPLGVDYMSCLSQHQEYILVNHLKADELDRE